MPVNTGADTYEEQLVKYNGGFIALHEYQSLQEELTLMCETSKTRKIGEFRKLQTILKDARWKITSSQNIKKPNDYNLKVVESVENSARELKETCKKMGKEGSMVERKFVDKAWDNYKMALFKYERRMELLNAYHKELLSQEKICLKSTSDLLITMGMQDENDFATTTKRHSVFKDERGWAANNRLLRTKSIHWCDSVGNLIEIEKDLAAKEIRYLAAKKERVLSAKERYICVVQKRKSLPAKERHLAAEERYLAAKKDRVLSAKERYIHVVPKRKSLPAKERHLAAEERYLAAKKDRVLSAKERYIHVVPKRKSLPAKERHLAAKKRHLAAEERYLAAKEERDIALKEKGFAAQETNDLAAEYRVALNITIDMEVKIVSNAVRNEIAKHMQVQQDYEAKLKNLQNYSWERSELVKEIQDAFRELREEVYLQMAAFQRIRSGVLVKIDVTEETVEADASCPICLDELSAEKVVFKVSCNHLFHARCITQWMKVLRKCPYCRQELTVARENTN